MAIFNNVFAILSTLFWFFCCVIALLRPRGVPLSRKVFYNPSQKFSCLDGSGDFPFHFVNDDFCDCLDGSDEPGSDQYYKMISTACENHGTAACPNGYFNCMNHGHKSKVIPSSRVNDGICDCCDASDEYNSTTDCLNICKELGQRAKLNALAFYNNLKEGNKIRNDYINKGKEKKETYKAQLENLKKKEQDIILLKTHLQDVKEKAEDQENAFIHEQKEIQNAQEKKMASEKLQLLEQKHQEEEDGRMAFSELDINGDGKLTTEELKSFAKFDYDYDGFVSDEEAKFYMQKKEEMNLVEFLSSGWKVIKPAFTLYKMTDEFEENDPSFNTQQSLVSLEADENRNHEDISIKNVPIAHYKELDAIFRDAASARKDYAEANKNLQDIQTEIWNIRRKLESDFGTEDEFLYLESLCFELSDKRYLYKFCPFDKIIQLFKSCQSETLIGLWDSWSGSDTDRYSQMKFSRGAICWNGPERSAEVILKCSVENKFLSVTEASPCTYLFEFSTPAACKNLPQSADEIINTENFII